jgi:hypothetical protein
MNYENITTTSQAIDRERSLYQKLEASIKRNYSGRNKEDLSLMLGFLQAGDRSVNKAILAAWEDLVSFRRNKHHLLYPNMKYSHDSDNNTVYAE